MSDYPHVHETVRPMLALSREARIAQLREDRWIDYPLAREAITRLEFLLSTPPRTRMPCMLIFGDSGVGKSMIIEKFKREHQPVYHRGRSLQQIDVLPIQMPPTPSQSRFYGQILLALGAPYRASDRLANTESVALGLLRELKPKMIVVDEVHHLLSGSPREQRAALNLLKFLANDLRCCIVTLGTRDAQAAMQIDPQIASRFRPFELPRWKDEDDFVRFLIAYESLLPLKEPSGLRDRAIVRFVLDYSEGVTGEVTELLILAAQLALRRGQERITAKLLTEATTGSPH